MKRALPPLLAMALILVGLSVGSLLLPDSAFSANENRYLKQAPRLTWDALMHGSYTADVETYTADQIALRDVWMGAKSTLQQLAGKQDVGGVWLGEDGYYFAKMTEDDFNRPRYEKNLAAVKAFFDGNADKDCRILLAPTPCVVLYDKLPFGLSLDNGTVFDVDECYDTLIDLLGQQAILTRWDLREVGGGTQQVYYRTDHHWTTAGARVAYRVWAKETGHTVRDYALTPVTDDFRGTLYSKVLLPGSAYDTVEVARDVEIVSMDCDGQVMHSLYVDSKLEQKDKYEVFMGGNYAKVTVDTGAETGRSLLLIKDSFANCFLPFLCADYDTITVVDLRYCRENMMDLASDCTDILVLYELTNFASDGNLYKLQLDVQ